MYKKSEDYKILNVNNLIFLIKIWIVKNLKKIYGYNM